MSAALAAELGILGYIGVILIVAVVIAVAIILVIEFGYDVRDELAEKRAVVSGIETFIDDWITRSGRDDDLPCEHSRGTSSISGKKEWACNE